MFSSRWIFKNLSIKNQISQIREKGTILGTRIKNGRTAYLYMIKNFCVEVIFHHDNIDLLPEQIQTFATVSEFNKYLEKEFKSSF